MVAASCRHLAWTGLKWVPNVAYFAISTAGSCGLLQIWVTRMHFIYFKSLIAKTCYRWYPSCLDVVTDFVWRNWLFSCLPTDFVANYPKDIDISQPTSCLKIWSAVTYNTDHLPPSKELDKVKIKLWFGGWQLHETCWKYFEFWQHFRAKEPKRWKITFS